MTLKPTDKNWRKAVVKKLDKEFSIYIRNRDGKCVTCGSTEKLTCGHYYSRVAYATRWDEDNCHAQCWGCNLRHEYDNFAFMKFMLDEYGAEELEEIHRRFTSVKKFKTYELLDLIVIYQDKNKFFKNLTKIKY